MRCCRIIFHLDGSGIAYDPYEPLHLDALLAWVLSPMHRTTVGLSRSDVPDDIPLPVAILNVGSTWVWQASAIMPHEIDAMSDIRYWRKKFRQNRAELTAGSPNMTNATYREWNQPMQLLLCRSMVAYAAGRAVVIRKLLNRVSHIGRKRAHGFGKLLRVDVAPVDYNWSCVRDGIAMRWLPNENGSRFVRPRPPYWNHYGRVNCCEVGDCVEST